MLAADQPAEFAVTEDPVGDRPLWIGWTASLLAVAVAELGRAGLLDWSTSSPCSLVLGTEVMVKTCAGAMHTQCAAPSNSSPLISAAAATTSSYCRLTSARSDAS